jgi:predicted DNA-binding transcriptional regulator YafY
MKLRCAFFVSNAFLFQKSVSLQVQFRYHNNPKNTTMSINKLALLRYKTIDKCLQNRFRKWTLEDLIEVVSDALYEYEGITTGVSRRTIQADIQLMRSDKLGYEAPIEVLERKYYAYSDTAYSITRSKVSAQDVEKLNEVVTILKQFKGFTYFEDIAEMVGKLEDKITKQTQKGSVFIDFEKNELLKGLDFIDILFKAVREKTVLAIDYQSFKVRYASEMVVYPYLLKEYRNRWFLLARKQHKNDTIILALDRMAAIRERKEMDYKEANFEVENYFSDTIGVSKMLHQTPFLIVLRANAHHAPYILTKPLHASQTILKQEKGELVFSINVIMNFELEREIIGFGEGLFVISPRLLKNKIKKRLQLALDNYDTDALI